MISIETFRRLSLSLTDAKEMPHFDKVPSRVNKKIFATLSDIDQPFFAHNKTIIDPVDNKWGRQGWTIVEIKKSKKGNPHRYINNSIQ